MDDVSKSASFEPKRDGSAAAGEVDRVLTAAMYITAASSGFVMAGQGAEVLARSATEGDNTSELIASVEEKHRSVVSFPVVLPSLGHATLTLRFVDEFPDALRLDSLKMFLDALSAGANSGSPEDLELDEKPAPVDQDLKLQLDMIPAMTWTATPDGQLESANRQWHDYTGLDHAAAAGNGFIAAFHPDDVERVASVWTEVCASGKPGGVEARMLRRDGEARYFVLRAVPRFDDDGKLVKWYGINTDIDDLKRTEFELEKSRAVMDEAQRIISTGSWSWDMATDVFTCSDQCAQIVGLETSRITFETLARRVHPEDREMVAEAHGRALQGEELNVQHRFVLDDGSVKHIHARGRLILDAGSKPRAYIGTIVDVTEAKLSEDRIRSSLVEAQRAQASLAEAQRLSHVGSFQIRPTTGEIVWSAETYNIYGLDPSVPLTAEAVMERMHPDDRDRVREIYEKGIRDRLPWEVEHRLLMPDGSVRHVHCVTRVETDPKEEVKVFGAIIDQTERVSSDEALRKAQADVIRMNRLTAMGAVSVSIAHEMNQPLMAMITNAAACQSWLDRRDPDIAEAKAAAERVIQEGKRAGDVLLNVRNLGRNTRPSFAPVDVNDVVRSVLTMLRSELRGRQIEVTASLAQALLPVTGDKVQLQQVLLNLVLNAAEAVMENGHGRSILITTVSRGSLSVVVSVQDNGPGIDPIVSERIFEAFFSTKAEGTGMGLAICKSIVQAHSGTLAARPAESGGAIFEIGLPCARGEE